MVTLTGDQWKLFKGIAEEEAGWLEYHMCDNAECKHAHCQINRPQATAIRAAIAEGEGKEERWPLND